LPKALLKALEKWKPSPSRLILSKMRSQIAEIGNSAEDELMQNRKPLQAGWYKCLLDADEASVETEIEAAVSRHCDEFLSQLSGGVSEFTGRILGREKEVHRSSDEIVRRRYGYAISNRKARDNALMHQNAYNCSKKPSGWHLTTGHIFRLKSNDLWICLSPACDLVPDQKSGKGRYQKLSPALPFHAVRLYPYPSDVALKEVNFGRCVFLELKGSIEAFGLVDHSIGEKSCGDANPVWEEFFAANQGRFNNGTEKLIAIHRSAWDRDKQTITTAQEDARIIAQLRYEYALNLLQRHGSALCRIGLGFVGLPQQVSCSATNQGSTSSACGSPA
jgi:hypothetical protein